MHTPVNSLTSKKSIELVFHNFFSKWKWYFNVTSFLMLYFFFFAIKGLPYGNNIILKYFWGIFSLNTFLSFLSFSQFDGYWIVLLLFFLNFTKIFGYHFFCLNESRKFIKQYFICCTIMLPWTCIRNGILRWKFVITGIVEFVPQHYLQNLIIFCRIEVGYQIPRI